jgi:hypothetical protein
MTNKPVLLIAAHCRTKTVTNNKRNGMTKPVKTYKCLGWPEWRQLKSQMQGSQP